MAVTHTVLRQYGDSGPTRLQKSETITGGTEKNVSKSIAVGVDTLVPFTLDRSILKSLCISSDVAITVYTNDIHSGSPQDTILIAAGQALVWSLAVDLLARCPIAGNITAIYVTNAAGGPAAFELRSLST